MNSHILSASLLWYTLFTSFLKFLYELPLEVLLKLFKTSILSHVETLSHGFLLMISSNSPSSTHFLSHSSSSVSSISFVNSWMRPCLWRSYSFPTTSSSALVGLSYESKRMLSSNLKGSYTCAGPLQSSPSRKYPRALNLQWFSFTCFNHTIPLVTTFRCTPYESIANCCKRVFSSSEIEARSKSCVCI
jgi:hypothetical protein